MHEWHDVRAGAGVGNNKSNHRPTTYLAYVITAEPNAPAVGKHHNQSVANRQLLSLG